MNANKEHRLTYLGDTPDDDLPDLSTDYWIGKIAKTEVRRGMPKAQVTKISTTIHPDPDVIEVFKVEGSAGKAGSIPRCARGRD